MAVLSAAKLQIVLIVDLRSLTAWRLKPFRHHVLEQSGFAHALCLGQLSECGTLFNPSFNAQNALAKRRGVLRRAICFRKKDGDSER
jgi:hypothetical protein